MMISSRAYLLKSFYEWLVVNKLTPYFRVDACFPGVKVPAEYIREAEILLDASPRAIRNFVFDSQGVSFEAVFRGVLHNIFFPLRSIIVIYAAEKPVFMAGDSCDSLDSSLGALEEENRNDPEAVELPPITQKKSSRPAYLRIVEDDEEG